MNSCGILFLEMGEISIEENEWSEEVSRKDEGTSRHDERSDEISVFGTKMNIGISVNSSEDSFSQRDGVSITKE